MSIYSRFGSQVVFMEAKLLDVWIQDRDGCRTWSYSPDATCPSIPIWHVRARYDDPRPGYGGVTEMEGWRPASDFVADRGWGEINDACRAICPDGAAREDALMRMAG